LQDIWERVYSESVMGKEKNIFVTGATGLIGSYLVKTFLAKGCKVYVLVRNKDGKTCEERVKTVLEFWDRKVFKKMANNLIILTGDLTHRYLGLNIEVRNLLKEKIDEIYHCGAITKFNSPFKEVKKTNVEGTKNILNLALQWSKEGRLERVNYFSTVYVCGNYKGLFTEKKLDLGQTFRSPYEQSKFEAEKLIQWYRKNNLWIDIFRLPVVVGESTTGKIFKFNHIYYLLRIWSLEILDIFPNEENFSIKIIPIDHLLKAIYYLSHCSIRKKNITYHLFKNKSLYTSEIFFLAKRYIGFKYPSHLVPYKKFNFKKLSPIQINIMKKISQFLLMPQAKLSSTYTEKMLKECNYSFPDFNKKYFYNIIKYAISVGFIKKHRKR